MPKIYDNIDNFLSDGLKETLVLSNRGDFCVGYFNLRGWKTIVNEIDKLEGKVIFEGDNEIHRWCRLLIGMQRLPIDVLRDSFFKDEDHLLDLSEASKLKKKIALEFKEQLTIGIPTEQDEKGLRKLSQQMKDGKVTVKLHLRYPLHAKLYLAYSDDKRVPVIGYLGSSNLTLAGLAKQGELNVDVLEQDAALKLSKWFEDRWTDRWCLDITKELIEIIDESWAGDKTRPPYYVYLKMAYHLSSEARAGISEYKLPRVFKDKLLEFQEKAVLVAAHHLNKRNGVLIGDVVGLGKTITATAVAKIFEDDFFLETLIICPRNLTQMWEEYAHEYQLRAKVISMSRVQTILPDLRRYRIVIIDESHNLRNSEGSRYKSIKSYLDENESKVILLSATPYNKTYHDLSNQLKLFLKDDTDLGISPERYIQSIGGNVQFNSRHADTFIRSIKAFEKSEWADDWRELMRLYLVRRTRSFIKNNYAILDESNNRKYIEFKDGSRSYFPDRLPRKVEYHFDPDDPTDQYARLYSDNVVNIINNLDLPRYGLANYLEEEPLISASANENTIIDNLSRAGKQLKGFCRTNLFKRLESSGHSFILSLKRHILRNFIFIYALSNKLPLPIGKSVSQNIDDYLEDQDMEDESDNIIRSENDYLKQAELVYDKFTGKDFKNKFDWIRSEFFKKELIERLIDDNNKISSILELAKDWNPNQDRQLNALYDLISKKHPKEKIIVFSQFADTVNYLTDELKNRGLKNIEWVSGESENPTDLAHKFSPISNNRPGLKGSDQELRVLISTDVLSEGQNLQDSHIIVNYDLPWAIIRLIQRAGRIDRIGQKHNEIICYSFLPEEGIEKIIQLRSRLYSRMNQNAEVLGSDETFFDGDEIILLDLYNEKSGILDDKEDENDVDLASYAFQIWKNATDEDPQLKKIIPDLPDVIYSTKENKSDKSNEGVIVYTKTPDDNDILSWLNINGEIITQSQLVILKAAQCDPDTLSLPKLWNHHDLVKIAIDKAKEDEKNTGGALGKKSGARYRVYMRLIRYIEDFEGTLFVGEPLKKAIDDLYKYPLKEFATDTLNRQMKSGISDEELANLVISLREDEKFCIVSDDELSKRHPQIICSLGLKN